MGTCNMTDTPMYSSVVFKNIGIKLCQHKCVQSGFCRGLEYTIPTLICHLSEMDYDTLANETHYFIGAKDLANVRASSCRLKTCSNLRCLETRSGKTECVKEKRNPTQTHTELNTTLFDACMAGDLARVKYILSDGQANINSRGKYNMTPVMHAARGGHTEVFYLLVRKGAKLSLLDYRRENILHLACIGGSVEIVKYIITQNIVGINSRDKDGMTPAMNAALYRRKDVFDLLVEAGADLLLVNELGETILHVACEGGDVQIIKYLLKYDIVDIDSPDKEGWTPVMHAANEGYNDVFDVIVEAGADLSKVNDDKETILHLACEEGNVEILKYLVSHVSADMESRDEEGCTPVMTAVYAGHMDALNILVEKGADILKLNNERKNVMNMACERIHIEIIKYLVKLDIVDIDNADEDGWTPVMQAASEGHKNVFDVLVEAGADLSQVNYNKENILHLACQGGNVEIIKYLLKRDIVDINSQDGDSMTPVLHTAIEASKDAFDILVKWEADLSLLDDDNNNILHLACDGNSVEIVKYLLTHNIVDINSRNGEDCTPALIAARDGHEAIFFLLVDHEADLTAVADNGDNILDMACEGTNVRIVKYVSTQHIAERSYREDNPC